MPFVNLDLEDLNILVTAYKEKNDKISSERDRLTILNHHLGKIVSKTGKDFCKDHNYINQDVLIDDIKRIDDLLKEVNHKETYFTKAFWKTFIKGE